MKLSIIIPCFNEPATLSEIIERVYAAPLPQGWEREVIVVDDGSQEATKVTLRVAAHAHLELKVVERAANGGKGAALKDGFSAASGDYLMVQDADLEYDPADIPTLLAPVVAGTTQVVFGSRQIAHNNVPGRFYYYWGGRVVNIVFDICFGTRLTDLTTCYKLFPKSMVPELLEQPANDFVYDAIEFSRVLARQPITEVSIHYQARDAAHGKKLHAIDGVHMLRRIITLRFAFLPRVLRFLVVGTTAAAVNVFVLYGLTNWAGLWYVYSEIIAFVIALAYNFTLQRVWTFGAKSGSLVKHGFPFLIVNIANLFLNTLILYGLVEYAGLWYVAAQIIASLLIAFESFFLYRWIFS